MSPLCLSGAAKLWPGANRGLRLGVGSELGRQVLQLWWFADLGSARQVLASAPGTDVGPTEAGTGADAVRDARSTRARLYTRLSSTVGSHSLWPLQGNSSCEGVSDPADVGAHMVLQGGPRSELWKPWTIQQHTSPTSPPPAALTEQGCGGLWRYFPGA